MHTKRTVVIFLTENCNWKCKHCIIPENNNVTSKLENFLWLISYFSLLKYDIILSGGEIGTLSEQILDKVFKQIVHPVKVNTNGEFIEKEYHRRYKSKISELYVHINENCSSPKEGYKTDIKIVYGIVGSVNDLKKSLEYYKNIYFDYIGAEDSDISYDKLDLDFLTKYSNVNQELVTDILKRKDSDVQKLRQNCPKQNCIFINLHRGIISLCSKNVHIGLPLNKDNLRKRLSNSIEFVYDKNICNNCYQLIYEIL